MVGEQTQFIGYWTDQATAELEFGLVLNSAGGGKISGNPARAPPQRPGHPRRRPRLNHRQV